jgi:hypothetical protein
MSSNAVLDGNAMTLKPMPLFDVKNPGRGNFWVNSGRHSSGTQYGPLLTDGHKYLCPECGGYGLIYREHLCKYCKGVGEIELTDPRVLPANARLAQTVERLHHKQLAGRPRLYGSPTDEIR